MPTQPQVLLLELGSAATRAVVAPSGKAVRFPAAEAAADDDDDNGEGSATTGRVGPRLAATSAAPTLATPGRLRWAAAANANGHLADVGVAERVVNAALGALQIPDERNVHLVAVVPLDGPIECAALWSELLGRFRFARVTFVTAAFVRLCGCEEDVSAQATVALPLSPGCGVVVDLGHSACRVTPFVAYRPLRRRAQQLPIGGYHLDRLMEDHASFTQVRLDQLPGIGEHLRRAVLTVWPLAPAVPLHRSETFAALAAASAQHRRRVGRGNTTSFQHFIASGATTARAAALQAYRRDCVAAGETGSGSIGLASDATAFVLPLKALGTLPCGVCISGALLLSADEAARSGQHGGASRAALVASVSRLKLDVVDVLRESVAPPVITLYHEPLAMAELLFRPADLWSPEGHGVGRGGVLGVLAGALQEQRGMEAPTLPRAAGIVELVAAAVAVDPTDGGGPSLPPFVASALERNIVVCGGLTPTPGLVQRLTGELRANRRVPPVGVVEAEIVVRSVLMSDADDDAALRRFVSIFYKQQPSANEPASSLRKQPSVATGSGTRGGDGSKRHRIEHAAQATTAGFASSEEAMGALVQHNTLHAMSSSSEGSGSWPYRAIAAAWDRMF